MQDAHTSTDEVLTVDEFARRLKVGRSTAYAWVHAGKLVEGVHFFRTPGGRIRFRWSNRVIDQFTPESSLFPADDLGSSDFATHPPSGCGGHRINLGYRGSAKRRYHPPPDGDEPSRKEVKPRGEGDG